MNCICAKKLLDLIKALLPLAQLEIPVPAPAVASLAALGAAPPAPPPQAMMALSAVLRVPLPPLPIPAAQIARLEAVASAAAQIQAGLGVNLASPQASAQLMLTVQSIRLNLAPLLAMIPLPPPPALAPLATSLRAIATARAMFGVNLLAPGAVAKLTAALAVPMPPPAPALPALPAATMARLSAYASLAAMASAFGGVGALVPAMQMLLRVQLPPLPPLPLLPLTNLSALASTAVSLRSLLSIDPLSANASLAIAQTLQPLAALEAFTLALPAAPAPASSPPMAAFLPGFSATVQALASANLSALATVKPPALGPLALVAAISGAGGAAATSPCGTCSMSV